MKYSAAWDFYFFVILIKQTQKIILWRPLNFEKLKKKIRKDKIKNSISKTLTYHLSSSSVNKEKKHHRTQTDLRQKSNPEFEPLYLFIFYTES